MAKDFVQSPHGGSWQSGLSFERFKNNVIPVIQAYELALLDFLNGWEDEIAPTNDKKSEYSRQIKTDLLIAKNPKNPYPTFLVLQKSENFSKSDLIAAMETLHEADLQLKSTTQNPKLVLEKVVFSICQKNPV